MKNSSFDVKLFAIVCRHDANGQCCGNHNMVPVHMKEFDDSTLPEPLAVADVVLEAAKQIEKQTIEAAKQAFMESSLAALFLSLDESGEA